MEIDLLGRFAVRRDGREVGAREFGGRLARQLVRILAAQRGRVVTREALTEALWDQHPPADPAANLNALVHRARRALGDPSVIETVEGGYLLRSGAGVTVDVEVFEDAADRAREAFRQGDAATATAAVETALGLWPGEPLPEDAYTTWAAALRDRLERRYQDVLEAGAAAALATGAAQRAASLAAEAVSRQPLREAAHLLLMRAHAAGGDQAAALACYDHLRRSLAEELGVDPSREAAELQRRLLRGELVAPRPPGQHGDATTPFVGRHAELRALAELGRGSGVALVEGRSGSGKSRLLQELYARTDRTVLAARALQPEREAPWSLVQALLRAAVDAGVDVARLLPPRFAAALGDLLPDLDLPERPLDPKTRRALVLQGTARVLSAAGRALLLVDDLQWADSSSLDLLTLLASRGGDFVMVLAYRPEEIAGASPVASFLTQLRSAGRPLEVRLGRLGADATGRMVASPAVAVILAEHTDGTPFAVLEVLRGLEREGVVSRGRAGVWRVTAPEAAGRAEAAARAGQQRAIWQRTQRQPTAARQLLGLLALLGRPASARLLSAATGADPQEVLDELHNLGRAELVRHDRQGYAPAHDLVGETVRDRLDPLERAGLHQLLAPALERDTAPADELARHLAGAGDLAAAAHAYVTAARQRLGRFADREAEQLASEGLALQPAPQPAAALLEIRAETRARPGELRAARHDLRSALTLATAGPTRARLLARLAALAAGAEDLLRAANLVDLALAEAGDDGAARARALYVAALVDMNLERPAQAQARFAEALALFTQAGDAAGVADILDARAMARFMDGDIAGGAEAFDLVAHLFADAGNLLRVVTPRSTRGHALVFAASPLEGLADCEAALEVARSLGYAEGEGMTLWHVSEALVACGRAREGLDAADAGLAIAERVGHRGWTATTLRARGIALAALGDHEAAEDAFHRSLGCSTHLPLFTAWAHAWLARLLVRRTRLSQAAAHVTEALGTGPPLAHYEARLARCELAVARGEPGAAAVIADAVERATAGGHRASLERLQQLRGTVRT